MTRLSVRDWSSVRFRQETMQQLYQNASKKMFGSIRLLHMPDAHVDWNQAAKTDFHRTFPQMQTESVTTKNVPALAPRICMFHRSSEQWATTQALLRVRNWGKRTIMRVPR